MQQQILLWCVLVPAAMALCGLAVAAWSGRTSNRRVAQSVVSSVIAVSFWCNAIAFALWGRQAPALLTADAWQRALWPVCITSMGMAFCVGGEARRRDLRWLIAGLGAILTGMMVAPSGEGWVDTFDLHRTWIPATAASALLNVWMLDGLARRRADGWVLWVCVAGLAGPLMLAAATFAGLAEWVLAAMTATGVLAIAASIFSRTYLWTSLYASVPFAAAATLSARFYSYSDHPVWVYALVFLLPSIVAACDLPLRSRANGLRITVAASVSVVALGLLGWWLLTPSPAEF